MTKTTFGFTFKNNNVLKSQRIKGLDLKSVPTYLTVKSDVNLSHRLMEQIQPLMGVEPPMMVGASPSMMVVRPQAEDIKTQLTPMTKVKHLQTFPQIEEAENIKDLGASPQIEEKGYPPMTEKPFTSMMEAPFTPLGETSNHKFIANLCRCHYPNRALSKILKLALVGYEYTAYTVRLMGFFCMRNISMRSHIVMAKLWRDAFERASYLYYWSTNPFQLCHLNYLVVIGKAPLNTGVHNCA